ncbi:hypothetical protein [Komagataeibacter sp. FNDCF1]
MTGAGGAVSFMACVYRKKRYSGTESTEWKNRGRARCLRR